MPAYGMFPSMFTIPLLSCYCGCGAKTVYFLQNGGIYTVSNKIRRTFQPRFFLFLAVTALLVVGAILLVQTVSDYIRERKAGSTLELPVTATADPNASPAPEASFTQAPAGASQLQPLRTDMTYSVSGSQKNGLSSEVRLNNESEIYTSNPRPLSLSAPAEGTYGSVAGMATFGGSCYRNSFAGGNVTIALKTLTAKWSKVIGKLGDVAGTGWTGQPLLIQWSAEVLPTLGVREEYKTAENFVEVLYPSADGNIYCYDLVTGNQTRDPIAVGVSMLGTATLDPEGRPMLYVGQGVMSKNKKGTSVAYMYAVDLIQNKVVYEFGGRDYFSRRADWNAFDSSPLILNDTLIAPAENGVIYFIPLNTAYDGAAGTIAIRPGDRIKYRYAGENYSSTNQKGSPWYGFESSCAAFRNYLFVTDNGGYLQCIDMNTLTLQYAIPLGGDADATPVIEEDGAAGTFYVYVGTQTDQGAADLPDGWGYCHILKIDGLTGQILWDVSRISYVGDGSYKSGCKATPHAGRGTISSLLLCAFSGAGIPVNNEDGSVSYSYSGRLVAFDKKDGSVVWSVETPGSGDYVSSPLVLYTERGAAYLIACDRSGQMNLYDAAAGGTPLCSGLDLEARIDSTPAACGNYLVVGTTGRKADGSEATPKIWCVQIQ